MSVPAFVEARLADDLWKRSDESNVEEAFTELGVDPASDFAEFFRRYWGPFHSERIGHEVLDLIEQDESIVSATQTVREEFGFANRFIVVSTLTGMSVLVYDVESQRVFDVDFEGGERLLQSGRLEARWQSWNDFLTDYFGG